jgi:transposase
MAVPYSRGVRDTDLYRQLLGLEKPWTVDRVELAVDKQRVDVWAKHDKVKAWPCPECSKDCGLHDHDEERTWRHLDSCSFQTHLHARVPRVRCPDHGVRQVRVPWAEPTSRFTALFERLAIDVLLETSISGATKILGLSWDEAHHIMERAVARGLMRRPQDVPRHMGIDEKAIAKGQRYVTLVNDLDHGHVIEVAEDRTTESLTRCLGKFSMNDLAKVKAFAMDMWKPYEQVLRKYVDDADRKIVFDRFHIVQHMNNAVDIVRRQENKTLRVDDDDRLVGTKYLWLYGEENLPTDRIDLQTRMRFAALRSSNLKTARAWALKESLRGLWKHRSRAAGERWWKRWYGWATRSRLTSVKKVAAMVKRHLPNVLTYFKHRITNAGSEAINTVVQMLKKRAFGYRNFQNFRTVILFRCGGLNLYPATHLKPG